MGGWIEEYSQRQRLDELDELKKERIVRARVELRKGAKKFTIIEVLSLRKRDVNYTCKKLKKALKCGGFVKENEIFLNENHIDRAIETLKLLGYEW